LFSPIHNGIRFTSGRIVSFRLTRRVESSEGYMKEFNTRVFSTLAFSIFTSVTGVGIVVPLLPVYAHHLGATGIYIALIFGAFSLSRTLFIPYFGKLSDRRGRKPFIVWGLLAYALISVAYIFSTNVGSLIAIRFVQGIASAMMMPVVQAYVGDITPEGREGITMGLFNISLFVGMSIGPLIGGYINELFSLQGAFIAMGVLSFIGFLLSVFFLPPTDTEQMLANKKNPVSWVQLLTDRHMIGLFLFRFGYASGIGLIWGFLPVFADTKFSLSSSSIGILVILAVLTSGLLHAPMGFLADRINKQAMIITGGVITACALFSYEFAHGFGDLVLANLCYGLGGGISMPALTAMATIKGNREGAMGSIMGLIMMAHSLGMLVGSLLGGIIMDTLSLRYAFVSGAFIIGLTTALFMLCTYPIQKPEPAPPS